MLIVAVDHFRRTYFAPCCSLTSLFCLVCYLVIFILPFFLANFQKSIWKTKDFNRYDFDSKITFNSNVVMVKDEKFQFSTIKNLEATKEESSKPFVFTSDLNLDKSSDKIHLKLKVYDKDLTSEGFKGYFYMFLKYKAEAPYTMAFVDVIRMPVNIKPNKNSIQIRGTVRLDQDKPYQYDKVAEYQKDSEKFFLENDFNIAKTYLNRRDNNFKLVPRTTTLAKKTDFEGYEIEVQLSREFSIFYRNPTVSDILRSAWPVYLAFFIPVVLFIKALMREAFQYHLFKTHSRVRCGLDIPRPLAK